VLGGSFDPVHVAHLRIAEEARRVFSLPRVLLVPCAIPPHKPDAELSAAEHRLEMLRLATAERAGLEVSTIELVRGGVSYTIDTLRALARAPAAPRPLFLLGMDSLIEIGTWRDCKQLLEEFDLVVVDRVRGPEPEPGVEVEGWIGDRLIPVAPEPGAGAALLEQAGGTGGRIYRLPMAPVPVSSSLIRERARLGQSLQDLVPAAVARYIQQVGLYGGRKRADP
jgi:nicotinate-nucleotide adenylyltransferase